MYMYVSIYLSIYLYTCVCVYVCVYIYIYICIHICMYMHTDISCDVIAVDHFSHQVIVFERTHIKQQSPDWKTANNHRIT